MRKDAPIELRQRCTTIRNLPAGSELIIIESAKIIDKKTKRIFTYRQLIKGNKVYKVRNSKEKGKILVESRNGLMPIEIAIHVRYLSTQHVEVIKKLVGIS